MRNKADLQSCFSSVDDQGKIVLLGTWIGAPQNGDPAQSIAQKFANRAKRTVIAPIKHIEPHEKKIASSEPLTVSPESIFKEFHVTN